MTEENEQTYETEYHDFIEDMHKNNKQMQVGACGHDPYFCMMHSVTPCGRVCYYQERTAD